MCLIPESVISAKIKLLTKYIYESGLWVLYIYIYIYVCLLFVCLFVCLDFSLYIQILSILTLRLHCEAPRRQAPLRQAPRQTPRWRPSALWPQVPNCYFRCVWYQNRWSLQKSSYWPNTFMNQGYGFYIYIYIYMYACCLFVCLFVCFSLYPSIYYVY